MLSKPLHKLTATEIVHAVAGGETTCEAVARACLDHIEAREPQVGAWHYLEPELVMAHARALDRNGGSGLLRGVPVGMKDIIDTADMPTEYGTPIHQGRRPALDAVCVSLTRRAGALIAGKTVTTEFANFTPGKTRHPMDPQRTPGGSSSGSAAAVGDCMVPLALGTQTTASTIRPASFCGCVGYRPTWGDIRCTGVMEASGSVDTLGIIARSVDDVALYRDVLVGVAHEPLGEVSGEALRIGYCRTHLWDQCEPETQALFDACASRLSRAGAKVEDVTLPPEFERIEDAHRWITSFEFARNRAWEIDHHWEQISLRLPAGWCTSSSTARCTRRWPARAPAPRSASIRWPQPHGARAGRRDAMAGRAAADGAAGARDARRLCRAVRRAAKAPTRARRRRAAAGAGRRHAALRRSASRWRSCTACSSSPRTNRAWCWWTCTRRTSASPTNA